MQNKDIISIASKLGVQVPDMVGILDKLEKLSVKELTQLTCAIQVEIERKALALEHLESEILQ